MYEFLLTKNNKKKKKAEIMSRLNHPNIIKMREFVETSEYYILVMELMRGGDLFDRLEKQVFILFYFIFSFK